VNGKLHWLKKNCKKPTDVKFFFSQSRLPQMLQLSRSATWHDFFFYSRFDCNSKDWFWNFLRTADSVENRKIKKWLEPRESSTQGLFYSEALKELNELHIRIFCKSVKFLFLGSYFIDVLVFIILFWAFFEIFRWIWTKTNTWTLFFLFLSLRWLFWKFLTFLSL
jgi:hypothetical protein